MSAAILAFLFSLAISPAAFGSLAIHSKDLRALLEGQNERVAGKKIEAEGASLRTGWMARSFLPQLKLQAAQERFRRGRADWLAEPTFGAEVSANLFNGGRDSLQSTLLETRAARNHAEKRVVVYQELLRAREAYWKILFYRDLVRLYREREKDNAASLGAADKRIRSGVATQSDRFEFEMSAVEIRQELGEAEVALSVAKKELMALLGMDLAGDLQFSEPLAHDHDWEELLQHSEQEHDFLSQPSRLAAEESALKSRAQARFWWPKLDAYAGWRQPNRLEENPIFARDRREVVMGIRASITLFDGLNSHFESKALAAETKSAEALASYAHRNVEVEIHRETTELRFLHSQVHEAEENIERAKRYQAITQSEYGRGVKNSPDVLGATEKFFQVKRKRLEILRDFQIAKAHVLSIIGR